LRDIRKELEKLKKKMPKLARPSVELLTERFANRLDLWTGKPLNSNIGGTNNAGRETEEKNGDRSET
jgi:hypothetical protein